MTEWEPATETEAAMRDALRANDQELYFRILTRTELLLPVPLNARSDDQAGWGTWTTGGRTHVLAFTSGSALHACLAENAGATRRTPYQKLAGNWPNLEWWLAVNPGLPIEGYLPAWFVTQLARGDVRLPGRTMGARARLERVEAVARARVSSTESRRPVPGGTPSPTTPSPTTTSRSRPNQADPQPAPPQRPAPAQPPPPTVGGTEPVRSGLSAVQASPIGSALSGRTAYAESASRTGEPSRTPPSWQSTPHPAGPRDESTNVNGDYSGPRPPEPFRSGPEPFRSGPEVYRSGPEAFREAFRSGPEAFQSGPEAFRQMPEPVPEPDRRAESLRPPPQPFRPAPEPFRPAPEPFQPVRPVDEATSEPARQPAVPADPPLSGWYAAANRSDARSTRPWAERDSGRPVPVEPKPLIIDGTAEVTDYGLGSGPGASSELKVDHPQTHVDRPPEESLLVGRAAGPPVVDESATVWLSAEDRFPRVADESATVWMSAEDRFDPTVAEPATATATEPAPGGDLADQPPLLGDRSSIGGPGLPADPTVTDDEVDSSVPVDRSVEFVPANDVEESLLTAASEGSTDTYLSTLLLATVLLPAGPGSAPGARPGEDGFRWGTETIDGETYVVVFTSPERLAERCAEPADLISVKFVRVIRRWPDNSWSFAVNPGTPVGAKLPGSQVVALANWAAEVGLGDDVDVVEPATEVEEATPRSSYAPAREDPNRPPMMQKTVAPTQVAFYLDRGYDRVSGFVHRVSEVAHLRTPAALHTALGLWHPGSPFTADASEVYVLRWPAYRPSLYRIPYGGQNEAAMRAMEGWVIERAPFRGNGFAPGESSDVVAEFKVDSARLPHGAELWRIGADGTERLVATLDSDGPAWQKVGDSAA